MMHVKSIFFLFCYLFFGNSFGFSNPLSAQENFVLRDPPSISLFNGRDLFGWKSENREMDWRVENGEIRVTNGPAGLLRTTTQFDNYILSLEFWATEETNSGVFLRTSPRPRSPGVDCFELNIAAINPYPTGSLVGQVRTKEVFRSETWHQLKIHVTRELFCAWIDGKMTVQSKLGPKGKGFIGLQKNQGEVRFKNIRLMPILQRMKPNDWNLKDTYASTANWDKDVLVLSGGSGQVESNRSFGNFLFFTSFKTGVLKSNSGVFFRCIPNAKMMGYESQIEFPAQGETLDWPVGSIFRRHKARESSAKDLEWGEMFIHADGPRVAVWINGEQVTDWSDRRKRNENPRRGLRTEAGTIILQGHDPNTKMEFKDMAVVELEPRQRGLKSSKTDR